MNQQIQFVEGRVRDSRTNQLKFLNNEGIPILDSQAFYEDGNTVRHEIPQNMAIIGVYGVKGKYNISSLGFLLWDISVFQNLEAIAS